MDTQVLPSGRAQPGPTRRPPTSGDTWGGGSVRSRPAGASVRAASDLRPRGTEKDIASHVWGRRVGAEGAAKAASGPLLPRSPVGPQGQQSPSCCSLATWFSQWILHGVGRRAHVWPALTPAHPHMFLHVHLYRHRKGPVTSTPAPGPPHFRLTSAGGGGAAGSPWALARAGLCEPPCPARLGRATGCLVLGSSGDCSPPPSPHGSGPPRPRASLPAPAVTSILLGGRVSRDVREEGRHVHGGSVSPGVQPLGRCLIALVPSAAYLSLPACVPGVGKRRCQPKGECPGLEGSPKLVSVQARWSTLAHPRPNTAPSSGGW